MDRWVSINGRVVPGAEARISVFDRGFLFGDAIYEVLTAQDGRLIFWEDHAARLFASAARLALPIDVRPADLRAETETVAARVGGAASLRLVVTRGEGLRLAPRDAPRCNRVIIGQPLVRDPAVEAGYVLHVVRLAQASMDAKAKTANKLPVVLAIAEAMRAGADEVLRVDDADRILEGGTSTFFAVFGGAVHTPPPGRRHPRGHHAPQGAAGGRAAGGGHARGAHPARGAGARGRGLRHQQHPRRRGRAAHRRPRLPEPGAGHGAPARGL